jgi:hypothetical protein
MVHFSQDVPMARPVRVTRSDNPDFDNLRRNVPTISELAASKERRESAKRERRTERRNAAAGRSAARSEHEASL